VPILIFLGLSVLEYRSNVRDRQTDRQTSDVRHQTKASLNTTALLGRRHNKLCGMPPQYATPPVTLTFDLLTLKVLSESRDVGYLSCANFNPRPLCSRFRPDVRDRQTSDRQTDVRQHHRLMPPPRGRGHNKNNLKK